MKPFFTTRRLAALLTAATLFTSSASADTVTRNWDKSLGNSDGGSLLYFEAHGSQNDDHFWVDLLEGRTAFKARARLFGKKQTVIDMGALARTDEVGPTGKPGWGRQARTWLEIGGQQLHTGSSSSSSSFTMTKYVPIVGPSKKYGVGPFSVVVCAGLFATVEPGLSAQVSNSSRMARAAMGAEVALVAGATGNINAGPAGSLSVNATVDLVSAAIDYEADSSDTHLHVGASISGEALRIRIKLVLKSLIKNYETTIVDKKVAGWEKEL